MKNPYKGKYFSILGDSISTLQGYNPPGYAVHYQYERCGRALVYRFEDTWWGMVIDHLKGKLLINNSYSGSLVAKHPECRIPSHACSEERTGGLDDGEHMPQVILIYMGTNDWGAGLAVESEDKEDLAVFENAYSQMLERICRNYPDAEIWCMTLSETVCERSKSFVYDPLYAGVHVKEYCRIIASCAEKYGARVIDLYGMGVKYDTFDGFHPNYHGMTMIAKAVIETMEQVC